MTVTSWPPRASTSAAGSINGRKALLLVAYTTAPRLGEILNLTWEDVDFVKGRVRIVCKDASVTLTAWEPKDHEGRLLPVPPSVMQVLEDLQKEADSACPYLFIPTLRWEHIQKGVEAGTWKETRPVLNNLNHRLRVLRKRAGVAKFTYHDLRRTCITNWAQYLPIHVVQKLAGHSDIKITQKHYLSVQEDYMEQARRVQVKMLAESASDQKVTNSA